jgi:hypothetical protein
MSWAAHRKTTRLEDQAYCLLGIFGVNMPLLYGEGSKAFLRLQEEILKVSDDQTIFAWNASEHRSGALAEKPSDFSNISGVIPIPPSPHNVPYSMTHKGLSICLPMLETGAYFRGKMIYTAYLDCQQEDNISKRIGMYICETDTKGIFIRCKFLGNYVTLELSTKAAEAVVRSIYIQCHTHSFYTRKPRLYCRISPTGNIASAFKIANSKINGLNSSWNSENQTMRIEKTEAAFTHDLAAGFVCYNEVISSGFVILVYFPHKSSFTTRLSGIDISFQPANWPFQDWLKSVRHNLSSAHVKETAPVATTEVVSDGYLPRLPIARKIRVRLGTEELMNQTAYVLDVEFIMGIPHGVKAKGRQPDQNFGLPSYQVPPDTSTPEAHNSSLDSGVGLRKFRALSSSDHS